MSEGKLIKQQLSDRSLNVKTPDVLDNSNAHELIEILTDAQSSGIINIFIDMEDLRFISSSGVGSILGTVELFREVGGDIVLCNLTAPLHTYWMCLI